MFISCRLDNCNALLYDIADNQIQRLQSVQNAAARLVTGSRRSEHITPVLRSLHWLYPSVIESRSSWQRLSTSAWTARPRRPDWLLSTDWRPSLRSEISGDLDTPRAAREIHIRRQIVCCRKAKHLELTCLAPAIRDPSLSSQGFRRLLKTYLFGWRMRR